jgi:hypothetical protein
MTKDNKKIEHIVSAQSLISYCRENEWVCSLPTKWNDLWKLLPEPLDGERRQPSAPLILAVWYDASNLDKMLRLTEHNQLGRRARRFGCRGHVSLQLGGVGLASS